MMTTGKVVALIQAMGGGSGSGGHAGGITSRVTSLTATELASEIIETLGIPVYVSDVTQYAEYGLTEPGWYTFARIAAKDGVTVGDGASVEGAKAIITAGADHVDVAVLFDVAAMSQKVVVHWDGSNEDTFIFKATDLAVRNLDYRTTFYVYDLAPFATWAYALTTDANFVAGSHYYVKDGDTYTAAEVQTEAYVLTADETFAANKTYYTKDGDEYTAATVTAGEAVPADTYYEKTTVPVPAYYKQVDGQYIQAEDGTFQSGVTYYTKNGAEYTEAQVTVGDVCPAYYKHSKLQVAGMIRNVTYEFDELVDCGIEITLPDIPDDGHGAWFEFQFRHTASGSITMVPTSEDVKTATAGASASITAGVNVVDLHYTHLNDTKLWTLANVHTNIPA